MPVCHAASIGIENESLAYSGPGGAQWRVPLADIRALGEFRSADDDSGHLLAVLIDTSGAWLQAPSHAVGMEEVLRALSRRWGADLSLQLASAPALESRILWPRALAGQAMFERSAAKLTLRDDLLHALANVNQLDE